MIEGKLLKEAVISGANHITNNRQEVDELNVFPVPDGDTGTNMSMTAQAAVTSLKSESFKGADEVLKYTASAMLRGARGNSGVILSLLFRGLASGIKGKEEINGSDWATALEQGVSSAYKAVMKPTEGTILTVARLASQRAGEVAKETNDFITVFEASVEESIVALENTPKLLPVLEKAGVVDAGGKGLVLIFEGMLEVFKGNKAISMISKSPEESMAKPVSAAAEYEGEITFTYCTEFIVNKKPTAKGALALRAYLESIGDSVVVVDDESIIKVHVHTDNPGNAFQEGLKFGYLTNMKVDNMRVQHEHKKSEAKKAKEEETYVPVNPEIPYGFVTVAAGQGIHNIFKDLGVDKIVNGGQTMNPSTDNILKAIQSVPAKTVFVLPNNKNIIMTAEQAVSLADRRVCVLQSRTIPQGISAMMAFDPSASFKENRMAMSKALEKVGTGTLTFAVRDAEFAGHKIKAGEILALENNKLALTEKDIMKAIYKLAKSLVKKGSKFMTILYGIDVTDAQAEEVYEMLQNKYGDTLEISLLNGGQPVYYYIISVE